MFWNFHDVCLFAQPALIISLLVLTIHLALTKYKNTKSLNYPNGPKGIPIIGFMPSLLDEKPHEVIDNFAKEYGDIFSITIAARPYIVLSSYETIKLAHVTAGEIFSDRTAEFSAFGKFFEFRALAFRNGNEWKLQRRILKTWLKHGNSQRFLEERVSETARALIGKVHGLNGQEFDIYGIFANSAMDLVSSLVCGQPLATNESDTAQCILDDTRSIFQLASGGEVLLSGWLINLIFHPFTKFRREVHKLQKRQFELMNRFIVEHQSTFDPSNIRDYIDAFLAEGGISGAKNPSWFEIKTLASNMVMFYSAGTDTTSTSLYFAVYLMAKYPEIQRRCQAELNAVIGSRNMEFSDRTRLLYIEAVLNEVLRYSVIGSLPQPRCTHSRTTLLNFDIPANTNVITNLWTATRDPKYFSNPNNFDPENFYRKNIPREISSLPFSAGKRMCPAEGLARLEIFMIFTSLLKEFNLSFPSEDVKEHTKEKYLPGFTRALAPFKIIATSR